jgi:hypothetical protein
MPDIFSPRKLDPNEQHYGLSLFLRFLPAWIGVEPRRTGAHPALAGKHRLSARRRCRAGC